MTRHTFRSVALALVVADLIAAASGIFVPGVRPSSSPVPEATRYSVTNDVAVSLGAAQLPSFSPPASGAQAPNSSRGPDRSVPRKARAVEPQAAMRHRHIVGPVRQLVTRVPTTERVFFLTIDDGWIQPSALVPYLTKQQIPVTAFVSGVPALASPQYFQALTKVAGVDLQSHGMNHIPLAWLPVRAQRSEICGANKRWQHLFDSEPSLFRPPYGSFDSNTFEAAKDCGDRHLVLWTATVQNGVVMFQSGKHLRPGDIVLVHFSVNSVGDIQAAIRQARGDGLRPANLSEFIANGRK